MIILCGTQAWVRWQQYGTALVVQSTWLCRGTVSHCGGWEGRADLHRPLCHNGWTVMHEHPPVPERAYHSGICLQKVQGQCHWPVLCRICLFLHVCLKRDTLHPPWGCRQQWSQLDMVATDKQGVGYAQTKELHTTLIAPSKSQVTEQCFDLTQIFISRCQRHHEEEQVIHWHKHIHHSSGCDLYHLH